MKIRRLKNFLNARVVSGASTATVMGLSLAWYASEGGFEPLIASVASTAAFLGLFKYSFLSFDRNLTTDRIALVVGNSAYKNAPLPNVENDINAVCESLAQKGFRIIKRSNLKRSELLRVIYEFQTILSVGGVGLFYYAGHAGQFEGRDWILPVDSDVSSRQDFFKYAVDLSSLLAPVDKIIEESPDHNGSIAIYSTESGGVAADGLHGEKLSPFAKVFLEQIERWNLEIFDLFRELCRRMSASTDGRQIPWLAASVDVEFYFKPIVKESLGVLKILIFDACRNNPFAGTPLAVLFEGEERQPEPVVRSVDSGEHSVSTRNGSCDLKIFTGKS